MEKVRILYLHQQFLNKTITIEEWTEFRRALSNADAKELLSQALDQHWDHISEAEMLALDAARFEKAYGHIIHQQQPKHKVFSLWYKMAAAAVLLIVSGGLFYYSNFYGQQHSNDILPGKMGATLTLSDGKKIKLTDSLHGELAKEAGVSITKNDDGQIVYEIKGGNENLLTKTNVLSTDKGETYMLILPDGSKVWLNAASSLTYFTSFDNSDTRRVHLDGEAYFEVSKNKLHPFIVESRGQLVEVLGTHFNINAYTNEPVIRTTLIEGSVKVSSTLLASPESKMKQSALLKPDQEATMDKGKIEVKNADTEAAIAWTNGKFIFRNEALTSIMRRVASWYGVEVEYSGDVADLTYWGAVSRNTNISSVLDYFSRTGNVEFKIHGKKITVIKINK